MAKILLIEDIPDNAELVRRILSAHGHEIIHAPDAETGLQLALDHRPDLILLDLGLPDYDGQTLVGWLRDEPAFAETPIIALTAWPEETVKKMVESYGFNGYISKPIVKINEFVNSVTTFLNLS